MPDATTDNDASGRPDVSAGPVARGQAEKIAVGFARALRAAGVMVPHRSVLLFVEAIGCLGLDHRDPVYWAGRATLVNRPEDRAAYDRVFAAYWLGQLDVGLPPVALPVTVAVDEPRGEHTSPASDTAENPVLAVRYSPAEVIFHRDFARLSQDEWAEAERMISEFRLITQVRRARRLRPSGRRGQLDVRRTLRQSIRSGHEPLRLAWRTRATRPRRLVLLVDVSGSMESYARALLRFAHAAMRARGRQRVEVYALGTRLTRLTRELSRRDPDAALASASDSVQDWSGGTRLGQCLYEFNDRWGARGVARGAVTVVFSDGWDRGDPDVLAAEMARLHRLAHRVVWVNPLKASPGFAPLARGMAAALPWVDDFVDGHSVAALTELAAVISGHDPRRPPALAGYRP